MYVLFTFFAIIALRLIDVSIGALRIQYLVRGRRGVAGVLGFFESVTWVIAAGLVLRDLDEWYKVIAYAAGFGLGTALGGALDSLIGSGQVFLRIVAPIDTPQAGPALRDAGFGATVLNGEGLEGDVRLTLTALPRRKLPEAMQIIRTVNPSAYVTIDSVSADSVSSMRATRMYK